MKDNKLQGKIDEWFFFINSDLDQADLALKEEIYHGVSFHSQQAAEKALKALILSAGKRVPKIHHILRLAELADKTLLKEYLEELKFLDQFYIPTRYPEAFPGSLPEGLPTQQDAEKAMDCARQVVGFVKEKLELTSEKEI